MAKDNKENKDTAKTMLTPVIKTVEYVLPTGAVVHARKPNNGDRRILMNAPEVNQRYLMEILAAVCATKIVFPEGHEMFPEGYTIELAAVKPDDTAAWERLDLLALEDSISFVEAFGANNWPSDTMIKQVMDAAKAKK